MPKPRFNKKSKKLPVVEVQLIRHSGESEETATGLSHFGEIAAQYRGKRLYPHAQLAVRHSNEKRTKSSGELTAKGFLEKGGVIYQKFRERKMLGSFWTIYRGKQEDRERVQRFYKRAVRYRDPQQAKNFIMRKWLDNKLKWLASPQEVAKKVIREEISFGQFLRGWPVEKNVAIRNVSHGWIIAAVFENLSGKRIDEISDQTAPPHGGIRENEGVAFTFKPPHKVFMQFRNRVFDVTKKYWEIIRKPDNNQKTTGKKNPEQKQKEKEEYWRKKQGRKDKRTI